jgi:hypothetical protein
VLRSLGLDSALSRDINATHTGRWGKCAAQGCASMRIVSICTYFFTVRNSINGAFDVHLAQITHVHSL